MSATIDLTKRTLIRAIAARMHRAQIADVLSVDGGAASVDESSLSDEQRAEATKILEEVSVEDVAAASRAAAAIRQFVKPSCSICHGSGIARRGGTDDLCVCVDRRWQAAVDHQAFASSLRSRGRASGVPVQSTRESDLEARATAARDTLARARAAAADACADLDAKIAALEASAAGYRAERERLDAEACQAESRARVVAYAQARAEEIALQIGHVVEALIEPRPASPRPPHSPEVHEAIDALYAAALEADRLRADLANAKEAAKQIVALDAANAPLVDEIARLSADRARIARHHQPKIVRAEKRLRRLLYVSGGHGIGAQDAGTDCAAGSASSPALADDAS